MRVKNYQDGVSLGFIVVIIAVLAVIGAVIYLNNKNQAAKTGENMENKSGTAEEPGDAVPGDQETMQENIPTPSLVPAPQPSPPASVQPSVKTFDITAQNFAFSQKEIRVKKGDTVKINFESTDGFHDWSLDGYNVKTEQVSPGTPTSAEFVADKAGAFEFFCSVGSHRSMGMTGKFIVE